MQVLVERTLGGDPVTHEVEALDDRLDISDLLASGTAIRSHSSSLRLQARVEARPLLEVCIPASDFANLWTVSPLAADELLPGDLLEQVPLNDAKVLCEGICLVVKDE